MKTKKIKLAFFMVVLCLFFSNQSAAWGSETHRYICEKAVEEIWSKDVADKCLLTEDLQLQRSICDIIKEVKGEENYRRCIEKTAQGEFIQPFLIPDLIFNDNELHYDYSKCPISEHDRSRKWICNESGKNLAIEQAELWFNKAKGTYDNCTMVYEFCIASNYISDSYMPLYQTMHVEEEDKNALELRVDKAILSGDPLWGIDIMCDFQYRGMRSRQKFEIKIYDIEEIIGDLVDKGRKITEVEPYITKKETCDDGIKNQDETDIDCGGSCNPCADGMNCLSKSDCFSNYCYNDTCRTLSCFDGIKNQGEEGIDCGGPCKPCPLPSGYRPINFIPAIFLILIICAIAFILTKRGKRTSMPKKFEAEEEVSKTEEGLVGEREKPLEGDLKEIKKQLNDIDARLKEL